MTTASPVIVDSAPARVIPAPPLPPVRGDELGPQGKRVLVGGVLAAHLVGGWALMQVDAVREAVMQAAPVLMVDMIASPEPPKPPPPPPPPAPKHMAPAPAPVIAAAPSPTPAPPTFVAPEPVPAPLPPIAAAPAPPAPPVVVPSAAPPSPVQIAPSAVRYVKLPELNYPALARRARESGVVVLRITVDVEGRLKAATVHRSSGFERLDQAALADIRTARFAPYTQDGKAVEWQTLAPLEYSL